MNQLSFFYSGLFHVLTMIVLWLAGVSACVTADDRPVLTFSTIENLPLTKLGESIMRNAYRELGYRIRLQPAPSERALVTANAGLTDGELGRMEQLAAYPHLIRVDEPYMTLVVVVWQQKERDLPTITDFEDMKGYRLALIRGVQLFKQFLGDEGQILANSPRQTFQLVAANRVDFALSIDHPDHLMRSVPSIPGIVPQLPPFFTQPVYHYLHVRHRALVRQVQEQILRMKRTGEIKKLTEQFLTSSVPADAF